MIKVTIINIAQYKFSESHLKHFIISHQSAMALPLFLKNLSNYPRF